MLDRLVNKFKELCCSPKKIEIEGHVIQNDIENKKSMVLIKTHNRVWKTTWLKNDEYIFKTPKYTLNSIFINK
jgi:hypothetical protein